MTSDNHVYIKHKENMNTQSNDWETLPQIEMEFMNIVHSEELHLVGLLLELLEDSAADNDIEEALQNWVAHTREHFEREEVLMHEYRFPPYPVHKREHEQALQSLLDAQLGWMETHNAEALLSYIQQDWRSWLQQHILSMDRVTAHFFKQMGVEVRL